ncbi:hypothetical protein OWT26_24085 [Burkholderia sp. 1A5]
MRAPATVLHELVATGKQTEDQRGEEHQCADENPIHFLFSVVEIGRLEPYGNARKGRVKGVGAGVKNA